MGESLPNGFGIQNQNQKKYIFQFLQIQKNWKKPSFTRIQEHFIELRAAKRGSIANINLHLFL
jgi:hypothetical protein